MQRTTTIRLASACLLLAGSVASGRAAEPAAPVADEGLAPLAWLAGSCWTGTFADGKTKGHVCYDWVFDRKFLTIEFVRDATQEWREILDSTSWREQAGVEPVPPS